VLRSMACLEGPADWMRGDVWGGVERLEGELLAAYGDPGPEPNFRNGGNAGDNYSNARSCNVFLM